MGFTETLIAAVEQSPTTEAGKKAILVAFLQAAAPALESLGQDAFTALLGATAEGRSVTEAVAATLGAAQVAQFLETTEAQMAGAAATHAAHVRASREALAQLEAAALGALARALVSAL